MAPRRIGNHVLCVDDMDFPADSSSDTHSSYIPLAKSCRAVLDVVTE
jgi:hypothetical protein